MLIRSDVIRGKVREHADLELDTRTSAEHECLRRNFHNTVFTSSFNHQVNDGTVENYAFADATVYVVDTSKNAKQITVGDFGDIQKYDETAPEKVFVRIYKDVVQEIVVIK